MLQKDPHNAMSPMPMYRCTKDVWALKIKDIAMERCINGKVMIVPEDTRYASFDVGQEYYSKHKPEAGGYYVVYKDGYKSYSPAKAFEEGYVRL